MKNYFFILIACLIAVSLKGQQAAPSIFNDQPRTFSGQNEQAALNAAGVLSTVPVIIGAPNAISQAAAMPAERTTGTGGGRWYDYADSALSINAFTAWTNLSLWNDTTAWFWEPVASAYYSADCESVGMTFDPFAPEWKDNAVFSNTEITISRLDTFVIDSLVIGGNYTRNNTTPAKTGVVDTLIVQFVSGNGGGASDLQVEPFLWTSTSLYGVHATICLDMFYDAVSNKAGGFGAAPLDTNTYKFLLVNGDESSGAYGPGSMNVVYPRAGHNDSAISFTVAAGNYAGVSVSYKSGDTTLTHRYGNDTVNLQSGVYEYNEWSPLVWYAESGSPLFPPYVNKDWTSGCFLTDGGMHQNHINYSGNLYAPNWDITVGANASTYQFPAISFHVTCATCNTVGQVTGVVNTAASASKVNVYPNPAAGELNISYTLAQSAVVTVTLTDIAGQVVVAQKMPGAAVGKAVINTAILSDGVYFYTLEANGEHMSGHVTIAH